MNQVALSALAQNDLEQVIQRRAEYSRRSAARLLDDILNAFDRLARYPMSGKPLALRGVAELRTINVRGHLVVYDVTDDHVRIGRILHSKRDIETLLTIAPT